MGTEAQPRAERPSRKAEIVTTFADMVAEAGYDNVALRDIAEALDMSKGTILHHFGSKDRLLAEIHSDYMARRLAEARLLLERLETPADQLRGLVCQLMIAQHDDRSSTVAFAREIVRFASDELMVDVRRMRDEYFGLVRGVIQRGMDEGDFVEGNAAIVTMQLFGMCNWSWTWYRPEGTWTADEIADTYCRTLFGGLAKDAANVDSGPRVPEVVRATMADVAGGAV
jgi:AcrR family transcriptional regulator